MSEVPLYAQLDVLGPPATRRGLIHFEPSLDALTLQSDVISSTKILSFGVIPNREIPYEDFLICAELVLDDLTLFCPKNFQIPKYFSHFFHQESF